ncbi:MAG: PAS domain S-box protein [Thioalkalispiraceae bacterium]|jgi:PAS domain S-box-containing protein
MKFRTPTLSVLLSVAIILMVLFMMTISMVLDLRNRQEEMLNRTTTDIKRQVAKLARIAEKALLVEPQLLFDDITQEATDPKVSFAAVVNSNGNILFSTDFSQINKSFNNIETYFNRKVFDAALSVRTAQIYQEGSRLSAYMSYPEPADKHIMRGYKRGLIAISYHLDKERNKVLTSVLHEKITEMMVLIVFSLIIFYLLRTFISLPIRRLENAAYSVAEGNYQGNLNITGPIEIQNLTTSFNKMTESLRNYINHINEQVQQTETVIENVIDGIITIDTQGTIMSYNKAAEKIFGYSRDEVVGKNIKILMPEPYYSEHDGYLQRYLETGQAEIIGAGRDVEGLRKNGEVFPLELGVSEIERNRKKLFIGIIRDITERHKVEKIKREFVSTVSHELRTPLTSLQGAVSLVASGVTGELPGQAKELMDNAKRNGDRLLSLINDLLDMDKIIEGKIKLEISTHDIQDLIGEAIEANTSYAKSYGVNIQRVGDTKTCRVNVDSMRIQQVLSNFLSNACKFSRKGGTVEIGVEQQQENWIRVFVRDHGQGIPDAFKSKIFEKFSQADSSDTRQKGGTGLGLAISKELIEMMNGKIGFESQENHGTKFYFDLPLA